MRYRLIEHLIEGQGSATTGRGYGLFAKPVRIVPGAAPIPNGFWSINTITWWNSVGRDYAQGTLGLDNLFIRDRIEEAGVEYVESTLTAYSDPTTIPNVQDGDRYIVAPGGVNDFVGFDGMVARREEGNWYFDTKVDTIIDLVPSNEKEILVRHQVGNMPKNMTFFPANDVYDWVGEFNMQSYEDRRQRIQWTATYITTEIPLYANQLISELIAHPVWAMVGAPTQNMYWNYVELGIKGTIEDARSDRGNPSPGILDYLRGRSIFSGQGFDQIQFLPTTSNLTKEQFIDVLYNVLNYGVTPANEAIFQQDSNP